jgi:hypothetical protein
VTSARALRTTAFAALLAFAPARAHAQETPRPSAEATQQTVVVWPTLSPAGDEGAGVAQHRPTEAEQTLYVRAQELDATLRDAVQDLGFVLNVADPGPTASRTRDLDLVTRAAADGATAEQGSWVISPRIELAGPDAFLVRIVAVPPKGNVLRVRVERTKGADVAVRGLVMLRELMSPVAAAQAAAGATERERVDETAKYGVVAPARSAGRAVLATSGALFGGFTAYSLQRASGNDDPRVLYPLLALGAGVGLGGSLLAADEWDIGTGDAWFLVGGTWWATASGILIANGLEVKPLSDRYNYGVGAGFIGLGLSTFALTRTHMDEGDAVLTHSGALLGLGVGAVTEMFSEGSLTAKPATGAGYGTAIGLATAGTLASFIQVPPSRVLLVDVGAGLGALAGAAAGSPLVFEDVSKSKARGFLATTAGGAVLGAGIAVFLTRGSTKKQTVVGSRSFEILPVIGGLPSATNGAPGGVGVGAVGRF